MTQVMFHICQKSKSTPRKIFDAVNKLWKTDAEAEAEKSRVARTPKVERKKKPAKAEDNYKTCDFCRRKFCDNAFERHVEFCRYECSTVVVILSIDNRCIDQLMQIFVVQGEDNPARP